jgi:hypothetical protein
MGVHNAHSEIEKSCSEFFDTGTMASPSPFFGFMGFLVLSSFALFILLWQLALIAGTNICSGNITWNKTTWITMENHHFLWVNQQLMVMFNSFLYGLPEGIHRNSNCGNPCPKPVGSIWS